MEEEKGQKAEKPFGSSCGILPTNPYHFFNFYQLRVTNTLVFTISQKASGAVKLSLLTNPLDLYPDFSHFNFCFLVRAAYSSMVLFGVL